MGTDATKIGNSRAVPAEGQIGTASSGDTRRLSCLGARTLRRTLAVCGMLAALFVGTTPIRNAAAQPGDTGVIDFRRGPNGAGQIIVDLAPGDSDVTINQSATALELEFANTSIEAGQQLRLDVSDFGTPVQTVSVYNANGSVVVRAETSGAYEYQAYPGDEQYSVDVTPAPTAAAGGAAQSEAGFSGERLSLNFQDIDVRAVLQILADFNDFSLVVGDNVSGTITLRLVDVPWDQALDLVLRARGLDQRLVGNVLYVAPAADIAAAELAELESTQQVVALAPLVTEYIEINYAEAPSLLTLLQGTGDGAGGGILSERGRATVDTRTNTLIVQDTETVLRDIRALLAHLDVPVRQVLIEARIVNATTSFSEALGIRWGGAQTFPDAGERFILAGSLASVAETGASISAFNTAVATALAAGTPLDEALALTSMAMPSYEDALAVDLGVTGAPSSIALGYAGNSGLLQLELSALEASGNGEVIAQPKVTTQDQQTARIESGLQIPYQAQAGGTAGGSTTEFVTAALSLEVTPQITPDGRIIMLLEIHQDSVVQGPSGAIPAIATNSVTTRVLVNDGDTVVLGGVFREEVTTTVSKTPFLGDLPYVGAIFKRTESTEGKTELLIFITPSIINDVM